MQALDIDQFRNVGRVQAIAICSLATSVMNDYMRFTKSSYSNSCLCTIEAIFQLDVGEQLQNGYA